MSTTDNKDSVERQFLTPSRFTDNIEKIFISNEIEKQQIIKVLLHALPPNKDDVTNDVIYWDDSFISVDRDSLFGQALQPGADLLQSMIDHPAFKDILTQRGIPFDAEIYVGDDGHIVAITTVSTIRLTQSVKLNPELADDLSIIVEIASTIGGVVFLDDRVGVAQWLKFYNYDEPKDVEQTTNLINHLRFEYAPSPPLGNYWEMITGREEVSVALSPKEKSQFRLLTDEYTDGAEKLLTKLCHHVLGPKAAINRSDCRELLHEIGTHPFFQSWSEGFIETLGWCTPDLDESVTDLYFE